MNYTHTVHSDYEARLRRRRRNRKRKQIVALLATLNLFAVVLVAVLAISYVSNQTKAPLNDNGQAVMASGENEEKTAENKKEETKKSDKNKAKGYEALYYYEADKLDRYNEFQKVHPDYTADSIVWMVNANLDKPFYGYDIEVTDITDKYVIVNKYYKLSSGNEPKNLVSSDGYLMTPETADAYQKMKADALANGYFIASASAYRSVNYQHGLYNSYLSQDPREVVDTYSARGGYSEHHTGMAIDFRGSFGSLEDFAATPEYPWVRDNCHKYGFIIRYTAENSHITGYKNEPWHLRYIGTEAAIDMKNKGVSSFEEYKVKYIDHKPW